MMNGTKDIADFSEPPRRPRLNFDLDADICVVGGGLAGLTMAREAALKGASVVLLEAQRVGWNASGNNLGTVMPGFGVPIAELIERVGFDNTRELWKLSQEGADYVRAAAGEESPYILALTDGALEVSNVEAGDGLIGRLQMLGEDFGTDVEGWQTDKVRESLKTKRYFHGIHYPKAFQIEGSAYVHHLAKLAERAGVRIFEDTSVVSIDPAGIRKRVVTPSARLRCSHIVLAGNLHLGSPAQRLTQTLMPTWRYAALTEPLGEKLAEAIAFQGSVMDSDGVDQFRLVQNDRLLWSSHETTWRGDAKRYGRAIRNRIARIFPQLGKVGIAETFSGAYGQTIHGMPQIGELRPGLWVLSGFGRQGLNTTAMGGLLLARSILWGDDRVKLFTPFELVWAGGTPGRVAGHAFSVWARNQSAVAGVLSRYRERSHARDVMRESARASRMAAAKARVLAERERTVAAMRKSNEGRGSTGA
jgi:glycine/D-amino acid oxidase-like deaminating enzyme